MTMEFSRCSDCTLCPLHEGVETVCVPAEPYLPVAERMDRAILVVGEAPGKLEDLKGKPFIGKSGHLLRQVYIEFFKFHVDTDVYLTNAVKCRPPENKTPTKGQIKKCQPYLLQDIEILKQEYKEVIVLCVGATACQSVVGTSLKVALGRQGDCRELGVPVFATYHPSYVLRDPSQGISVKSHLQMLRDFLDGGLEYAIDPEKLEIDIAPPPPKYQVSILSLDIETYGAVTNKPKQTMFHPRKSEAVDGVCKEAMIETVGISWRDPKGELKHAIFVMKDRTHQRRLLAWIMKCQRDDNFKYLVGANIIFDLMYLRYCYKEFEVCLNHHLPIWDTIISNYLYDENRPEKSLKNLAPLLRVTKYNIGGDFQRFSDAHDPNLWKYNCQDTAATLLIHEKIERELSSLYGGQSNKLGDYCYAWYSDVLWLIIWMTETGVRMDDEELSSTFERYKQALERIMQHSLDAYGAPLRGKGSEKSKRAVMESSALRAMGPQGKGSGDVPLKRTKERGLISFNVENRNTLLPLLPRESREYKQLKLMGVYQDVAGLLDRYLYPLLVGRGKAHDKLDTVLLDGVAYPRWFPVPSEFEDSSGGTKQARIVAKAPPVQTFPPIIKKTITGRFPSGFHLWFDYSQIELRIAALLSNDGPMMEEYQGKPDLHGATAKLIFGHDIVNHQNFQKLYRQAGKRTNFLMLFLGQAKTLHESLMKDVGLDYPIIECAKAIDAFWKKHHQLSKWQKELLAFVRKHGYYELPLIGQSRLFLGAGGRRNNRVWDSEIVNLPIQATAANIMLSCQYELWRRFKEEKLKAVAPMNVYDAAFIECPKYEIYKVRRIIADVVPNPPYFQDLCEYLGRSIPLEYDLEEYRSETTEKNCVA